jgi:hypothetical protein
MYTMNAPPQAVKGISPNIAAARRGLKAFADTTCILGTVCGAGVR